jgi:hypothetical protein
MGSARPIRRADQSEQGARAALAAIGFTVKSGWASAVLVGGAVASPKVVDSRRIELSDPAIPDSRQPYHAGFGTARRSGPKLSQLLAAVKRFGRDSVTEVIRDYRNTGYRIRGVGIVVGSLIDPERIGNDHIRIHALEGQLFRGVVEDAAARGKLACSTWRHRDLQTSAAEMLHRPEPELRATLAALGKAVPGSWRAEHKAAALAAWLALAGRVPVRRHGD